ncbi:hypothetical protein [Gordonia rhizosphera]|uniref:Uncharacterized protein n=1 Tax=Gordonia rhizosphera NBRC 16068 TaxID=1108045 RepID=K6X3Q5_9ACTN|nr:hypothetical protein [Gordonia rhizosphera]GAB93429.1 hypothetical protein GORHZ_220_00110 [Gordonia rhizosphera NBRC 16068]
MTDTCDDGVAGDSDESSAAGPDSATADTPSREPAEACPLSSIVDRSVAEVLTGHGLPSLPALPSSLPPPPGLPVLPAIDLEALIKPLTDLLGCFGTGDLASAEVDPATVFAGLAKVLEATTAMSADALEALDTLWTGAASAAAVDKSTQISADTRAVSAQSMRISVDVGAAADIVAAGSARVACIVAATVGKIAGALPLITTPAGQTAVLGFVADGLAEAIAAVAATRSELLGPTGAMRMDGTPVPITDAPVPGEGVGGSPLRIASTLLRGLSPILGSLDLPSSSESVGRPMTTPGADRCPDGGVVDPGAAGHADTSRPGPVGRIAPAAGGTPVGSALAGGPLTVAATATGYAPPISTGLSPESVESSGATQSSAGRAPTVPGPFASSPAPMAPLGMAGPARADASDGRHDIPRFLLTSLNGRCVIGAVSEVAPAVLGDESDVRDTPLPDIGLHLDAPVRRGDRD